MSTDVRGLRNEQTDASPRRRHRRYGLVLMAVAVWNVWLWLTRVWNLVQDPTPRSTGFVVVHAVLYGVSFVLAIVVGLIGWRLYRESRGARS